MRLALSLFAAVVLTCIQAHAQEPRNSGGLTVADGIAFTRIGGEFDALVEAINWPPDRSRFSLVPISTGYCYLMRLNSDETALIILRSPLTASL